MRALLDGVFQAEEGFEELENDAEFEDKGGEHHVYLSRTLHEPNYLGI